MKKGKLGAILLRHLATIREIASLRPIAGADRIEVAERRVPYRRAYRLH